MGLQQRVGVARAMISEPEVVVLDEPTSALDPTARAEIIDLLIRIQRELGTAYLFISHDLSAVRHISHRIAVLYLGKVVEQGPSAKLFARPRHPYSVALLSSVLLPNPRIKRQQQNPPSRRDTEPDQLAAGVLSRRALSTCDRPVPQAMPPVETVAENHTVRCYRHQEVARSCLISIVSRASKAKPTRILGASVPAAAPSKHLIQYRRRPRWESWTARLR